MILLRRVALSAVALLALHWGPAACVCCCALLRRTSSSASIPTSASSTSSSSAEAASAAHTVCWSGNASWRGECSGLCERCTKRRRNEDASQRARLIEYTAKERCAVRSQGTNTVICPYTQYSSGGHSANTAATCCNSILSPRSSSEHSLCASANSRCPPSTSHPLLSVPIAQLLSCTPLPRPLSPPLVSPSVRCIADLLQHFAASPHTATHPQPCLAPPISSRRR